MNEEVKVHFFGAAPCEKCGKLISDEERYCQECIERAMESDYYE